MAKSREIFDDTVVDKWLRDPLYIERLILKHIVETCELSVYFEYLVVDWHECNALSYIRRDGTPSTLVFFYKGQKME